MLLGILAITLSRWVMQFTGPPLASSAAIYKGNASHKQVAIACNVVWGTEYVSKLLAVLQKQKVHITFFLGGQWAKDNPHLAKTLAQAGMEIGNHGYGHRHVASLSLQQNIVEIQKADAAIFAATGIHPSLYAPAYGEVNSTVTQAATRLHYQTIMWSIDTIDWRPSHTPSIITQRVLSKLHNGAIILMHPTSRTLAALPALLKTIQAKGYKITTVGHVIAPESRTKGQS